MTSFAAAMLKAGINTSKAKEVIEDNRKKELGSEKDNVEKLSGNPKARGEGLWPSSDGTVSSAGLAVDIN